MPASALGFTGGHGPADALVRLKTTPESLNCSGSIVATLISVGSVATLSKSDGTTAGQPDHRHRRAQRPEQDHPPRVRAEDAVVFAFRLPVGRVLLRARRRCLAAQV